MPKYSKDQTMTRSRRLPIDTRMTEPMPWQGTGGGGILELGEKVISDAPWSDYPIAGHDDDMDEDERYFLDDEDDNDGDDDSDADSDYDDGFADDDDDEVDENQDSDDENF
ncbi:MAG: hypothetical protein JKY96_07680 [Phycisphaerales bacterium]|nr:hypothetical protein [Phycisphaerales bacterium]